jgi:hypothetical protein
VPECSETSDSAVFWAKKGVADTRVEVP